MDERASSAAAKRREKERKLWRDKRNCSWLSKIMVEFIMLLLILLLEKISSEGNNNKCNSLLSFDYSSTSFLLSYFDYLSP